MLGEGLWENEPKARLRPRKAQRERGQGENDVFPELFRGDVSLPPSLSALSPECSMDRSNRIPTN
jgi:hypothetical protein